MLAGLFSMTVVLILFFKVKIIFLSYELVFAGEQIADNSSRDSKVFFCLYASIKVAIYAQTKVHMVTK